MSINAVTLGASILVIGAAPLAIIPAINDRLHADVAKQCITHAWPAEKHREHIDFCTSYGFKTEPKQYITTYAVKAF